MKVTKVLKANMGGEINLAVIGGMGMRDTRISSLVMRYAEPRCGLFTYLDDIARHGGYKSGGEVIADNVYRWGVQNRPDWWFPIAGYVGTTGIGDTFELIVDSVATRNPLNTITVNTQLELEEPGVQLVVVAPPVAFGNGAKLKVQYVQSPNGPALDLNLLQQGRRTQPFGSMYEEGSERGQNSRGQVNIEFMYNAMQTQRFDFEITGDALTQALYMEFDLERTNAQGQKEATKSFFPNVKNSMGKDALTLLMEANEKMYMWGTGNFDALSTNGNDVTNRLLNSGKPLLATQGLHSQLDLAQQEIYNPYANGLKLFAMIKQMQLQLKFNTQMEAISLDIITGLGGRLVFSKAVEAYMQQFNVQIINSYPDTPDGNLPSVPMTGEGYTQFKTPWGTIRVIEVPSLSNPRSITGRISYEGLSLPIESFYMYVFPFGTMSDGSPNVMRLSKGKDGVDRGLVAGYIPGMTGKFAKSFNNGKGADGLPSSYPWAGDASVSSGRDAELFMLLSQSMLVIRNPFDAMRLMPDRRLAF